MANVDRSLVADLSLFAGLSPAQLDDLLREAQSVRYPKGMNVFQQDEEAHSFFVLLHGHLRVYKLTPDGQQVVVPRRMAPGERAPLKKRRPAPGAYGPDYTGPRPAGIPVEEPAD